MNATGRSELDAFAGQVLAHLGFRLDEHNAEQIGQLMRERIERTGCRTVDAYLERFKDAAFAKMELREVAMDVTVPETYFFRHPEQFQALAQGALPACIKRNRASRQLRILSAGCASGEEAYSIAACLPNLPLQGWDVGILGVDVNARLLEQARQACYSEWSLRALSEPQRRLYFWRKDNDFVLADHLKAMVGFEEGNLLEVDASFWKPGFFDIIFCRNVMIYLSANAVRTLVARLSRSLAPEGFLFLGPSETLRGISQDFHLRHTHGAFYYQRKAPGEPMRIAREAAVEDTARASASADPNWVMAISKASGRIAALADQSQLRRPHPPAANAPQATPHAVFPAKQDMEEIRCLLREERFEDALRALDALPPKCGVDPDALMIQAVLLANSGELGRAEQLCEQLLAKDELRPGAHYLMAVCREKSGDQRSAAEHDQTAIYLDARFAMPRLHLGLLARRLGDLPTARRELTEALTLLAGEDSSRILLFGGGFTREALIRFCKAQLELCGGAR